MTMTEMSIESLKEKFANALANKNFNTAWQLVGELDGLVGFDEIEKFYEQLEAAELAAAAQ